MVKYPLTFIRKTYLTTGLFFSPHKIELDETSIRADRKGKRAKFNSLGLGVGWTVVLSLSNFNIAGIAGLDFATGEGAPRWQYQGSFG
jgi:hypothetical protein